MRGMRMKTGTSPTPIVATSVPNLRSPDKFSFLFFMKRDPHYFDKHKVERRVRKHATAYASGKNAKPVSLPKLKFLEDHEEI